MIDVHDKKPQTAGVRGADQGVEQGGAVGSTRDADQQSRSRAKPRAAGKHARHATIETGENRRRRRGHRHTACKKSGGGAGTRTPDQEIMILLLYQLSYTAKHPNSVSITHGRAPRTEVWDSTGGRGDPSRRDRAE